MPTRGTPRFQQMEDERDERDMRFFFRRCLPAGAGRDGLFVLSLEPDGNGFGNEPGCAWWWHSGPDRAFFAWRAAPRKGRQSQRAASDRLDA
jgi:hypothetical protein